MVSSFTKKPIFLIFRTKSSKSLWIVGSPPQIETHSRIPCRFSRNWKKFSVCCKPFLIWRIFSGKTNSLLWQYPHRRLHPSVKTTHATRPGKSRRLSLSSHDTSIFACVTRFVKISSRIKFWFFSAIKLCYWTIVSHHTSINFTASSIHCFSIFVYKCFHKRKN